MKHSTIFQLLKVFLFAAFLIHFLPASAQNADTKYRYIEPSFQLGFHPFKSCFNYPTYCINLRYGIQTTGKKTWESLFNYPKIGIGVRYEHNTMKDYIHPNIGLIELGNAISVYGYCNGHLIKRERFQLDYSWGAGISYWTKHGNALIGAPVTVHLTADCGPVFRLNEAWDLFGRISFTHASNGAIVLPNRGTNIFYGQMGCRYYIHGRAPELINSVDFPSQKKNTIYFFEALGFRESNTIFNRYCVGNTFEIGYTRAFHPCYRFGGGLDLLYTGENKIMYEYYGELENYTLKNSFSIASVASFDIVYGRFIFHIAGAYYIFQPTKYVPRHYLKFYERLGFRYMLGKNENLFMGVSMKVHGGRIDYIEWTIGSHLFSW